jgi:O-antigen/teichoic acid export membrane protein
MPLNDLAASYHLPLDVPGPLILLPPEHTRAVGYSRPKVELLAFARRLTSLQRLSSDGTFTMLAGTIVAGVATYAWQAAGTRTLGKTAFAPVANTWTLYFLIVTILLAPIEQFATRTVAAGRKGGTHLARALRTIVAVLVTASILIALVSYLLRSSLFRGSADYALVSSAIVLSLGQLAICRGILVGKRNFAAYGWLTALDSFVRLLVGLPIVLLTHSPLALVWTIPLCSLVALAWIRQWPSGARISSAEESDAPVEDAYRVPIGRFLVTMLGGTSAAQLLLAGGPLLLALLGAAQSAVTVLFVTQTACRAAFLMATPVSARSLPSLTRIAVGGDYQRLGKIAIWLLGGSVATAAMIGAASLILTPPLIAALFGSGVRPSAILAATMASGTVLAIGNLGLNQILVAAARTHRITVAWWAAVAAATTWVLFGPGDPLHRVSIGFVLGELVALLALVFASNVDLHPKLSSDRSLVQGLAAPPPRNQ